MALVDNAPGSGRYEVLKATLRYLYNIPFKSEADGTLTMPRLDSILEAVRGCSVEESVVNERIYCFAEHIINSLFIPILAEGGKTEAPPTKLVTPHGSAVPVGSVHGRLALFRDSLIDREGGRCAITGHIDTNILDTMLLADPTLDEDSMGDSSHCEGAHIIPHGRNEAGGGGALSESKKYFWTLLGMFAPQLGMLVLAENIDKPYNGLFLTHDRHKDFGALKIWLEETQTADTYILRKARRHNLPRELKEKKLDKPITFKNHAEKDIDLPNEYLLKIHASLARILEASGAAEYVEHLLRETDKITALSDDVTDLTAFFASRGLVEVR
ncbi:hypothetical protein FN846DRAFT_981731 [Sphaerosporella brunnea]|uniref:HNH nuclease domain-containing protein n=1 Tax=Sphaerosporella brunnea TaxID=1250544 RepID=A0A5J5ECJ3_9PEZI|nr:hypothetical protein FN846DRAFT_981731 [Sphaerosporella brunnea]